MVKQVLIPLVGGNCINIYPKTALQGQRAAAGLPLTACMSHCWINGPKSRCANFLYLMMMGPNYARSVAMSFLMYDS